MLASLKAKMLVAGILLFLLGYGLNRAVFGPSVILIENQSALRLSQIRLIGTGFSQTVSDIQSGDQRTIVVYPTSESGLKIEFIADGKHMSTDDLAYIEPSGGYCERVVIDRHLGAKAHTFSVFCFSIRRLL